MDSFSISDLEQFSGIKAHTIRIWEQRYNALKPRRTEGNTRYYDGSQLRRLLNIVSLMNTEYKVSEICQMTDEQHFKLIETRLNQATHIKTEYQNFVNQLIASAINYDELHFEKIFSSCLLRYGMQQTYLQVIYPMLISMGMLWNNNSMLPSQNHFISNIIRQKLFTAVDAIAPSNSSEETWILFLPENELHDIGLLFANYLLRQAGKRVIYLGANTPFESLIHCVNYTNAGSLYLFFVHYSSAEFTKHYLDQIVSELPDKKIYISGNDKLIHALSLNKKIIHLHSIEKLQEVIHKNNV